MTTDEHIVVGIFEDRKNMRNALSELKQAQFSDEQLGFVLRDERGHHPKHEEGRPHPILRGLVGGLLGIADALLVPITGPSDAANIFATSLPVVEDAIDHIPQGHHPFEREGNRPDAPMTADHAETAAEPSAESVPTAEETEEETEQQEQTSTITGEVVGGVLGAAVGVLIPGIGPAIVVGSLASLFGVAFGGLAGGFLGTFVKLGIPEKKAREYEKAVKAGKVVLTVHADARKQEAEEILLHNGASHVETH